MKIQRLLVIMLSLCLVFSIIGCKKENIKEIESGITWTENEDGSYTFTNHDGTEESVYAWYILDGNNEVVYKTAYSDSAEFIWDFEDNLDYKVLSEQGQQKNMIKHQHWFMPKIY